MGYLPVAARGGGSGVSGQVPLALWLLSLPPMGTPSVAPRLLLMLTPAAAISSSSESTPQTVLAAPRLCWVSLSARLKFVAHPSEKNATPGKLLLFGCSNHLRRHSPVTLSPSGEKSEEILITTIKT